MCNWKSYTIYDSNQGHAGTSTAHIHTGMWGVGQIALFSLLFLLCLSLFAKLLLAVSVIIKLLTCSSLVSHMTVNAQTEILAINSGPECVSAEKNKKTKSIHTHTHTCTWKWQDSLLKFLLLLFMWRNRTFALRHDGVRSILCLKTCAMSDGRGESHGH